MMAELGLSVFSTVYANVFILFQTSSPPLQWQRWGSVKPTRPMCLTGRNAWTLSLNKDEPNGFRFGLLSLFGFPCILFSAFYSLNSIKTTNYTALFAVCDVIS
jgi:hypothetical protein